MKAYSNFKPQLESLEGRALLSASPFGLITNPHNGPVIAHVQIEMIFYGNYWFNNKAEALTLQNATQDLIGGNYMDGLAQLGVGRGSVDQVDFMRPSTFGWNIGSKAGVIIAQETGPHHLGNNRLPGPANDRLFVIIGGPDVTTGTEWHGNVGNDNFAFIPFNDHDFTGETPIQSETWGITHEVVEAVTDPNGHGWQFYQSTVKHVQKEICDVAENIEYGASFSTRDGTYDVSPYWLALVHQAPPGAGPRL